MDIFYLLEINAVQRQTIFIIILLDDRIFRLFLLIGIEPACPINLLNKTLKRINPFCFNIIFAFYFNNIKNQSLLNRITNKKIKSSCFIN
jgi:hypothetical protein